jgi:hypothetical protein
MGVEAIGKPSTTDTRGGRVTARRRNSLSFEEEKVWSTLSPL